MLHITGIVRQGLWLLLFASVLSISCEKEKNKCQEESLIREQGTTSLVNPASQATVHSNGWIDYEYSYAYFEVCTHSPVSFSAEFGSYGTYFPSEVRLRDVYENVIVDWQPLTPKEGSGTGGAYWHSFTMQDVSVSPKDQETILLIDVRMWIQEYPRGGLTLDEIHEWFKSRFSFIQTKLRHHRPEY